MKSQNYPEIEHNFHIIKCNDRLIFAKPNGDAVGEIVVETMETDMEDDGKWKTVPTENFWIQLRPLTNTCQLDKNFIEVIVDNG